MSLTVGYMINASFKFCALILVVETLLPALVGSAPQVSSEGLVQTSMQAVSEACVIMPTEPVKPFADSDDPITISGHFHEVDWKSLVGKLVTIKGDMKIVDTHNLARYGEVRVARERLHVPTSRLDPNDADPDGVSFEGGSNVAKVVAAQKRNDKAVLTLDDGRNSQNVFPPKLFPKLGDTQPTVRLGSIIKGVSGRVVEKRNTIYLIPSEPLKWVPAERPARPSVGDADITVASFNVLNYFTTIDNGSNNARGADSKSEFTRQDAKIVSAIIALKADVIGLMEIENKRGAEQRLVAALNKASGKDIFKGCGIPVGFRKAPGGGDAIRVALIYRADRVSTVGGVTMIRDTAFSAARTPVVQTFRSEQGGEPFTVVVNHFKSKGGARDANAANKNKGDGQGAHNATRRSQALAIVKYVDGLTKGDPRVLILGDLNAYQQEDPIDALRAGGLVDLVSTRQPSGEQGPHYSYVYYGQCGSLDHAMANTSLAKDITGVATWHINADEPRFLDYNEENNPRPLFKPDPFRSSDHDPVLIGIRK